ncbi:MAG: DUF4129 domain-containing protein [Planctomycetales bacterium]
MSRRLPSTLRRTDCQSVLRQGACDPIVADAASIGAFPEGGTCRCFANRRRRLFILATIAAAWALSTSSARAQPASPSSPDDIRRTADRILSEPEFRYFPRLDAEGAIERSKPEWDQDEERARRSRSVRTSPGWAIGLGGAIGAAVQGFVWIALLAIVGAIGFFVVRAFLMRDRALEGQVRGALEGRVEGEDEPERAPGDVPADEYLARSRRLAAEGRYAEAIAQLLLGGMSHLERAGVIRHRRGITYRDYVRAAAGRPPQDQGFRSLVRIYEPIGFGRRPATREHFETGLASYESGFARSA